MKPIVYINGNYVAAEDAKISVFDRGFLFADSVYEVIPVYHGQVYFAEKHLARLESSLASARIPMPQLDWMTLFQELITRNNAPDLQIYLQITRGNQGMRKHDIPAALEPTVVAFTIHTPYPTLAEQQQGLRIQLVEDIRWLRCDIKTTALLANVLLNDDAVSVGASTALLVRDGFVTEGSTSNVFMVDHQGTVYTPPKNNLCLPGITRQLAIDLISSLNWDLREEKIARESLLQAKEVWITSTTKEIYPVTQINDITIGQGYAGDYWQQLNEKYQQLIK